MAAGIKIISDSFNQAAQALEKQAVKNTQVFAQNMASQYESAAKSGAPWTDQRGNARAHLYGSVKASGSKVTVEMGGSAPNYKGSKTYPDYMEILEFGWESKDRKFPNLAIVYPTYERIKADFAEQYGKTVLGTPRFRISRSREGARQRARNWRARNRAK